jgi:hypothetical protein
MITQKRFTFGEETRKHPYQKRLDFEELIKYKHQHAKLVEDLDVRLTPVVSAQVRRDPQALFTYYAMTNLTFSLGQIEDVSDVKPLLTIAINQLNHIVLEMQRRIGNCLSPIPKVIYAHGYDFR